MDSYLAIIGVALAIAALMPVLFPEARVRFWTVTAGALSLLVLIGIYQAYKQIAELNAVRTSKQEIATVLRKSEKGMSFDQLYDNMYYPEFATANTAIDELVLEGRVSSQKVEGVGPDGAKFVIRRFYWVK
jgi:hypothetical protein